MLDDVTDAACFDALFDIFAQPAVWTCDPDAYALFAKFHERGIRQALASNFDSRLRGVIASMPLARYLESIIISSEIGWRKPAPEFFAHVADSLRLPTNSILFVGDDRVNDYEAALKAGMQAMLVGRNGLKSLADLPAEFV